MMAPPYCFLKLKAESDFFSINVKDRQQQKSKNSIPHNGNNVKLNLTQLLQKFTMFFSSYFSEKKILKIF